MKPPAFAAVTTETACTFCRSTGEARDYCTECEATTCALSPCQIEHWETCAEARNQWRERGAVTVDLPAILFVVAVVAGLCLRANHPGLTMLAMCGVVLTAIGWLYGWPRVEVRR